MISSKLLLLHLLHDHLLFLLLHLVIVCIQISWRLLIFVLLFSIVFNVLVLILLWLALSFLILEIILVISYLLAIQRGLSSLLLNWQILRLTIWTDLNLELLLCLSVLIYLWLLHHVVLGLLCLELLLDVILLILIKLAERTKFIVTLVESLRMECVSKLIWLRALLRAFLLLTSSTFLSIRYQIVEHIFCRTSTIN